MKTIFFRIVLIASILSAASAFTQDWMPVPIDTKLNYRHSDLDYISHTLWIDSIETNGPDTLYYLNRIAIPCPGQPDKALRNRPQFLQKTMVRINGSGLFRFVDPGNFYLDVEAATGSHWVFDSALNIIATVTGISVMEIFGVPDSVKTIGLDYRTETTIRLSKSFGIIEFPDLGGDGIYVLEGIQNTSLGRQVPGFWEVFDFENGDVFQYNYFEGGPGPESWEYRTTKFTINSKTVTNDGFSYVVSGYINGEIHWYNGPTQYYSYPFSYTYTYNYVDYNYLPWFNNQLIEMPEAECYTPSGQENREFSIVRTNVMPFGLIRTLIGRYDFNQENNIYYEENASNDTLILVEAIEVYCFGVTINEFGEGQGRTKYNIGQEESQEKDKLVGYIKDGDTVGVITPDSLLCTSLGDERLCDKNVSIWPNPVHDVLFVEINSPITETDDLTFMICDIFGNILKTSVLPPEGITRINLQSFTPGLYFFEVKNLSKPVARGKFILY